MLTEIALIKQRNQSKHFYNNITTSSDGSPAEDADLFYCTAITEKRLRRAEEFGSDFRQRQEL